MDTGFALTGYVVDELIGFGGTGEVWRAHDAVTGETVALKRLRTRGTTATERLRREAALLAAVAGPHVIRVRGLIVEADEAVLVMDYAAGGSLAAVLGVRGQMPAPEVVTILAPIAAALAAAHARDLVHGDLTPANVLFTADGRPLLADFGVAQALGSARDVVEGTVDFLDPAVAAGAPLSGASDIFALGAVGFTALAGQSLWGAGTPDQIQARASIGVRPSLDELAPDAPPALVVAIESALRLDPDERPDARSLANAVLRAGAAAPVGLVVTPPPVTPPMTGQLVEIDGLDGSDWRLQLDGSPAPTWRTHLLPWRRYLVMWVAVALSLIASVGLGMALGRHGPLEVPVLQLAPAHSAAASRSAAPPVAAPSTPRGGWRAVVSRLDDLRSRAFADAEARPLSLVYAAGAAAYPTDLATVSSLASRGLRARGFRATVERVTAESGNGTTQRLRVVDRLSAYSLVDHAGHVVGHGVARSARAFTMELKSIGGSWRVASVTPAP